MNIEKYDANKDNLYDYLIKMRDKFKCSRQTTLVEMKEK